GFSRLKFERALNARTAATGVFCCECESVNRPGGISTDIYIYWMYFAQKSPIF
ncbi:hypothetical protein M5D96_005128, partial [Drosophila gunungcola]